MIIKENNEPNNPELLAQLSEIYKEVLEKEHYIDNKTYYLPNSLFRAVLFLAIKLRQIGWVKEFIDKYTEKVNPNSKDQMYNYGYSYFNFLIGRYPEALECINKINFDYFQYKYDIKILKLKIFYELGYLEETLQNIHSYKEFLRVDNLLDINAKTMHQRFLYFLEKLVMFKFKNEFIDIGFLGFEITNSTKILYKEWLLEKIGIFAKTTISVEKYS